jgi:hypothetical protein
MENAGEVIVTCAPEDYGQVCMLLDEEGSYWPLDLGETMEGRVEIFAGDNELIDSEISDLKSVWAGALEEQLAGEVVTA